MAYCKRAFATSVGYFTKHGNHQWTHEDPVALFPLGIVLTTEEEHSTMRDLVSSKWCKITLRLWGASLGLSFLYYGAILAINTIFSSTEKEEQEQDRDTFNFDYTAIIASSLAEIWVCLTLVILMVDTKGHIYLPKPCASYVMGGTCGCLSLVFVCFDGNATSIIVDLFLFGMTLYDGSKPLA
jgi:hypothetical protein